METSYDELNRPALISEGGRVTRYGYDLGGRAVVLIAGNGQTSNNTYDALGRLVDRTLFKTAAMSESEVLAQFSWEHDALGNVTQQLETWPGSAERAAGIRSTVMTYDGNNRLHTETVTEDVSHPTTGVTATTYTYDAANNRSSKTVIGGSDPGVWTYTYNEANQLTRWEQEDPDNGTLLRSATLTYDGAGNRASQNVSITGGASGNGINPPPAAGGETIYQWDAQDRLSSVTLPNGETHSYDYDYRTRRIGTHKIVSGAEQAQTAIVFAGGLSLAEYDSETATLPTTPTVEYTRGPDMGGGVGGMLYSMRASGTKYSLNNGRGDIVAQADSSATLTWTASYEAYGRRTKETGSNEDKQRGNSKDEDPTGLLNEELRYRDLETGVWLSRDPAGFVDGPNVYAYVKQNPWTAWDPHGLSGWMDPRGLPGCSPQLRTALEEQDRQTGARLAQDAHAVGQWLNEHPRTMGAVRAVGGATETTLGVAGVLTPEPTMVTKALGGAAIAHGGDTFIAGVRQMCTGKPAETITQRGIAAIAEKAGASPEAAKTIGAFGDAGVGLVTSLGTSTVTSSASVASRVSAAEVARLGAMNVKTGTVNALVVPNGLVPKVFVGASTRANGAGILGLENSVYSAATRFTSKFKWGCAEGQSISKAIGAGVNPSGGVSFARAVSSGKPLEACDNCRSLLSIFRIKDAVKK